MATLAGIPLPMSEPAHGLAGNHSIESLISYLSRDIEHSGTGAFRYSHDAGESAQNIAAFLWSLNRGFLRAESGGAALHDGSGVADAIEFFRNRGCVVCHGDSALAETEFKASRIELQPTDEDGLTMVRISGHPWTFPLPDAEARWMKRRFQPNDPPDEAVAAEAIENGRRNFISLHCANCHRLPDDGGTAHAAAVIPFSISATAAGRGCLEPSGGTDHSDHPLFHWKPGDRESLTELAGSGAGSGSGIAGQLEVVLNALQCVRCHQRGNRKPDAAAMQEFVSLGEDLGEEGRIPPTLDFAGRKFQRSALVRILTGRGAVRPYMPTVMPAVEAELAGWLADAFAAADRDPKERPTPREGQENLVGRNMWGRELMGVKGLGCVVCHQLNGNPSLGIQAIDLALAPDRLRPEWFRDYLIDPPAFRAGTRMPSFWPDGKPTRGGSGGSTDRQIDSIWAYLVEIDQSRLPEGLDDPSSLLLSVDREPVIFRTFFQGAGLHSLALGWPEGVHAAFDSFSMTLSPLWKGGFLNAENTWENRFTPWTVPASDHSFELFPAGRKPVRLTWNDQPLIPVLSSWRVEPDGAIHIGYAGLLDSRHPVVKVTETITAQTSGISRLMDFSFIGRSAGVDQVHIELPVAGVSSVQHHPGNGKDRKREFLVSRSDGSRLRISAPAGGLELHSIADGLELRLVGEVAEGRQLGVHYHFED